MVKHNALWGLKEGTEASNGYCSNTNPIYVPRRTINAE